MPENKTSPSTTKQQALQIREAWSNIGETLTFGDIALTEFQSTLAGVETLEATIKRLEDQLTDARNSYTQQRYKLWDYIKRVRSGTKAKYGDDSSEYERFGGTRISDRRSRKPKPAEPSQPS